MARSVIVSLMMLNLPPALLAPNGNLRSMCAIENGDGTTVMMAIAAVAFYFVNRNYKEETYIQSREDAEDFI